MWRSAIDSSAMRQEALGEDQVNESWRVSRGHREDDAIPESPRCCLCEIRGDAAVDRFQIKTDSICPCRMNGRKDEIILI